MDYRHAAALLRKKDQILILTHRRPDGDTIGSAAALCHGLRNLGKTAYVLHNPDAHDLFTPYFEGLTAKEGFSPQFVLTVDTAAPDLIPDNANHFVDSIDLCIDHHGSNSGYAKETCVDPACAACGELMYLILKELGAITEAMAMLLYVAISTDTGCFVFSNTTPQTHRISADLMDIGCSHEWVNKRHFRTKSLSRLKLESMLTQEMLLLDEGRTVIVAITLELIARVGASEEDLENIASVLEQLKGVENAVTLRELQPNEYKISLRTGRTLNASAVCALLGGGGHPSAAGCTVAGNLEMARDAIIRSILQIQGESLESAVIK